VPDMNIATIGRGKIGSVLAARWRRAGHSVTTLGRDGGEVSAAEVLLVAVPSFAIADALGRVKGLNGQLAIDVMNAVNGRGEAYESLTHEVKAFTGSPAAKAFNLQHHLLYDHVDAQRKPPSNLFAADVEGRTTVAQLIRDAGFDPVYVGGLEKARALEDCVQLFGAVRIQNGGEPHFHRFAKPGEL
jgi:8-hydroxy-5-deazaflavin:NADPH oxidoreductase